ncbi:MAG: outer membrane beta-barrel protein [Pseudomonadota bacterium]|nr:MAG: outer membrane beta-barrel protein [Pseudomonadota bacterium]
MSKLTRLGCAVAMLFASSVAWAGGDTGFYIGAAAGSSSLDVSYNQSGVGDVKYDDSDKGYKVFLGYNFGIIPLINFAVEGSYVDLGKAQGTALGSSSDTTVTGMNAYGLLGFNLGPVMLFGKAGSISWDSESTVLGTKYKSSGSDPAYGVGVQFQLFGLGVRAEYERFDIDTADIGFASIGLSYTF